MKGENHNPLFPKIEDHSKKMPPQDRVVFDCKVDLAGLPDETYGVEVLNERKELMKEVTGDKPLEEHQFRVDYTHGYLYFHPVHNKKTVTIQKYYSRGMLYFPASRVYSIDEHGRIDINTTLQDYIDSIKSWIFQGDYQAGKSYTANNSVYSDGSIYIAKQDVPTNKIPKKNPEYWQPMSSGFLYRGEYDSSETYYPREIVAYQKGYYACLQETENITPNSGAAWQEIVSVDSIYEAWQGADGNGGLKQEIAETLERVENTRDEIVQEWEGTENSEGLKQQLENMLDSVVVEDNLTSTSTTSSLSANQGKVLNDTKQTEWIATTEADESSSNNYVVTLDPAPEALYVGMKITIIPHATSTSKTVRINVNGFGNKLLRVYSYATTSGIVLPPATDFLREGKPVSLMYNGTYWIAQNYYHNNPTVSLTNDSNITPLAASAGKKLEDKKADKQTAQGGFVGGEGASAYEENYPFESGTGGAIGKNARVIANGGAVGENAETRRGGALGYGANATDGGAVGDGACVNDGGAVGVGTKTDNGFAGGYCAQTVNAQGYAIDAIQLGTGTNTTEKTLQVYDYPLLDANGKIPVERLVDTPGGSGGKVKNGFVIGNSAYHTAADCDYLYDNTNGDISTVFQQIYTATQADPMKYQEHMYIYLLEGIYKLTSGQYTEPMGNFAIVGELDPVTGERLATIKLNAPLHYTTSFDFILKDINIINAANDNTVALKLPDCNKILIENCHIKQEGHSNTINPVLILIEQYNGSSTVYREVYIRNNIIENSSRSYAFQLTSMSGLEVGVDAYIENNQILNGYVNHPCGVALISNNLYNIYFRNNYCPTSDINIDCVAGSYLGVYWFIENCEVDNITASDPNGYYIKNNIIHNYDVNGNIGNNNYRTDRCCYLLNNIILSNNAVTVFEDTYATMANIVAHNVFSGDLKIYMPGNGIINPSVYTGTNIYGNICNNMNL